MLAGSSILQFPDGMPCHSIHTSMVFPSKYVLTVCGLSMLCSLLIACVQAGILWCIICHSTSPYIVVVCLIGLHVSDSLAIGYHFPPKMLGENGLELILHHQVDWIRFCLMGGFYLLLSWVVCIEWDAVPPLHLSCSLNLASTPLSSVLFVCGWAVSSLQSCVFPHVNEKASWPGARRASGINLHVQTKLFGNALASIFFGVPSFLGHGCVSEGAWVRIFNVEKRKKKTQTKGYVVWLRALANIL